MGLHTHQQNLILGDMMTTRKKLEEDNQRLRDELHDARMMIHLLKLKVKENEHVITSKASRTVNSQDSTVEAGVPSRYLKALEWAHRKSAKKRAPSRKDTFKNPAAQRGQKTFSVEKRLAPLEIIIPNTAATNNTRLPVLETRSQSAPRSSRRRPRATRPKKTAGGSAKRQTAPKSLSSTAAAGHRTVDTVLLQDDSHSTDDTSDPYCERVRE